LSPPPVCDNGTVSDSVYFDGDPATESTRRHMERVLKGEPTRKWPWVLGALGSGAIWMFWRAGREAARRRDHASSSAENTEQG
jgi:hypothetical protein